MDDEELKVIQTIQKLEGDAPYNRKDWYDTMRSFTSINTRERIDRVLDEYEKKMGLTKTSE